MRNELYRLANQAGQAGGLGIIAEEKLDEASAAKYKQGVLGAIRQEKRAKAKKRWAAAAASVAVLLVTTGIFHNEVQAAIEQIRYSISSAIGLKTDLAAYKEVIHTSVTDNGLIVTLQEAIAAPEKLAVTYTVQREDGKPIQEQMCAFGSSLLINGEPVYGGASGSIDFLDKENKTVGCEMSFDANGIDLHSENTYELKLSNKENGGGFWSFKFQADGSSLFEDTEGMELGNGFELPDGTKVILDKLTVNDFEQRITFHTLGERKGRYYLELYVEDAQGRKTEFYESRFGEGKGYMLNSEWAGNGRIETLDGKVKAALYCGELPEESGQITDAAEIIGEPVIWDLSQLK